MLPVSVVYAGLAVAFLGGISILTPLAFLGIHSRFAALSFFVIGLIMILVGATLPPKETRVAAPQTRLDEFVPFYQFHEFHSTRIHAPTDLVFQAIKEVRADEIFLFRTLTWIRRFGRSSRESILNPSRGLSLLDVATRSGFLLLAEEPDRELVFGMAVIMPAGFRWGRAPLPEDFKRIRQPGFALAVMNFRLAEGGAGLTLLTTETRIYATDLPTRRRFARYWRVIYPGSAFIRRMWLRAIRRRAEIVAPS